MQSELEIINPADALVPPGVKQVGLRIALKLGHWDALLQGLKVSSEGLQRPREEAGKIGIWTQGSDGRATFTDLPVTYEDLMSLLEAHRARCEKATARPTIDNGCIGIRELREESDRTHERIQAALQDGKGSKKGK